jgi:hypothetical protein
MTLLTLRTAMTGAAAVALGLTMAAAPASAAPNDADQDGLVNLALQDTNVQLPIAVAADVCGVAVNVLAQTPVSAPVDCTADGVSTATRESGGPNTARQEGLVNVAVQDTNVQVPVAVAANVCGLAVNALATTPISGPVTCDALADAVAEG